MKQRSLLWGFGFAMALVTLSCGDDSDDDDDSDGGSGGSAGSSSGSAGKGGSGGTGSQNVSCDPEEDTVCQNENDCDAVESGEARASAQSCGLGCLEDDDPGVCAVSCIVEDTDISSECATCYAGSVQCASENCLAECAADPTSDDCNQCQIDAGCRSEFNDCSGLDG
jgi:hypothetical protein